MLLEGPFERLHTLMGFENALCALVTDPDEAAAFFDRLMEVKCQELGMFFDMHSCGKMDQITPAFVPLRNWWFPIAMDEAEKCGKEIFQA